MTIGFGIVGTGMIAKFHAEAINHLEGAKLVACQSRRLEVAQEFAGKYNIIAYQSLEEMLANPDIHIITICTPSGVHLDPAVAAANAGKHVIVEKPLEITLKRCDAIIEACRKNKVLLGTIMPSRFSPVNQAVKAAVDAGRLGKITLGDTFVKWWRTQEYYDSGAWRGTWDLDGGGAYMNQAIHNVDLLYWFMGEVSEVTAMTSTLAHERIEVEDTGVAVLKFKHGGLGSITASTSAWPGLLKKTELHGNEGTIIVEQDDLLMWKFANEQPEDAATREKFSAKAGTTGGASDPKAISFEGHRKQFADFIEAINNKRPPLIDGEQGRKSVEMILAIYQSSWTGKKVTLPLNEDPVRPA
jgi:predicted dehydrogenase